MQNKIEAVIWDMGGVLIRTFDPSFRLELANWLGMSEADLYSLVFESESSRKASLGIIPEQEHWNIIQDHLRLNDEDMHDFRAAFWAGDDMDRDLINFIQSLRPRFCTGLLSNAWSEAREVMTRRYSLLSAFDVSIFSAEIRLAKPDPVIYQQMLEKLSLPPEKTVFIDDMQVNVDAAMQLGMHGVVFHNREQVIKDLAALNIM